MSHGGAESGGVPPEIAAKFVAGQSQDGKAPGSGGPDRPAAPLFSNRSRDGIASVTDQDPTGIPASAAPTGLTSVGPAREAKPADEGSQPPVTAASDSRPANGQRGPGQPVTEARTPTGSGHVGSVRSVFEKIQSARKPPETLAPKPGEQGAIADDTAGGGAVTGEAKATTNGHSQEPGNRFGLPRTRSADATHQGSGRPSETTPPITEPTEPQDYIPGRPGERTERPKGRETDETQEQQEVPDEQTERADTHAHLLFRSDRAPVAPPPAQPPSFVIRANEIVANTIVARSMPDHPDVAAKRRSKIPKYAAKVAHHLSTKAKEAGGFFFLTVGGSSVVGLATNNETGVGVTAAIVTALLVGGSAKADFLPELLAFKYTAPVIGTTAATATLAELTATGVAPTTATEATVAAGGALIIWGANDIRNKIIHGRLVKKDAANTDKEFLTKLRLGKTGAGGEPGEFENELIRREDALLAADNEHKRLKSERKRFYYEALPDEKRKAVLEDMERNESGKWEQLEKENERWRKEAADRLANMKPKKKAYMRTFWQSLTDTQRYAFTVANDARAQQYIGSIWDLLNTAQKALFAKAGWDENLRQTFANNRLEWRQQALEDMQETDRRIIRQQRYVDLAIGRRDRALEIQAIVAAGKTMNGKLKHVEEKRKKKGQPDNQPV